MIDVFVTKYDGTKQRFDKEKIVNTCIRMGADEKTARVIAEKINFKIYDGIPTRKILQMIFQQLKSHPKAKHQIDLRKALSLLRPQPDFERFIHRLLREHGYKITPNQIIKGKCVEHEIDGIASIGNKTLIVEIKHHVNPHTYTSLDSTRIAWATLEDLTEGVNVGEKLRTFAGTMIICNTKFSQHAKQYAACKGLLQIGWKEPAELGLERMIEDKKCYPITFLRGLKKRDRGSLLREGIILLKDLRTQNVHTLSKKTKIPKTTLHQLIKKSEQILFYPN